MKKTICILVFLLCLLSSISAQKALVYVWNLGPTGVDVRLGEEQSPLLDLRAVQPGAPRPMMEVQSKGQAKLYVKPSGTSPSAWEPVKGRGGDRAGQIILTDILAGRVYGILIGPPMDGINAWIWDYTAEGRGPMVQFANMANVPMDFGVGPDKGRWDGMDPFGYVGPGSVGPFQAMKKAGTFGIFFESFLWDDSKKVFLPSQADPAKPAQVPFRDGAYYAVLATLDAAENPRFALFEIPAPAAPPVAIGPKPPAVERPAVPAGEKPSASAAAPTAVPASWNGEYMEERRPGRAALAVHDGKIWSVFGGSQTEAFPGPSVLYRRTYGETECRSVYRDDGKEAERYVFDPKTGRLTYYQEGAAPVAYVPMKK